MDNWRNAWRPQLGPLEGEAVPLDGGITNRNYRVTLGGTDYVVRVPGKDTNLLEIDRNAERIANERAARIGIAPPVAAALDEPQAIVTLFVDGEGVDAEALREPGTLTEVARSLRAMHELGEPLPVSFDSFRIVETYAETARARGPGPPAEEYRHAGDAAARIEAALQGPEHEPVPCHNDLLAANFIRGAEAALDRGLGVRGHGRPLLRPRELRGQQRARRGRRARRSSRPTSGSRPDARRFGTLRVMRFMSDFREAMWGVVQSALSELDFDFDGYAMKHFERMHETASNPEYESWLEAAGEPSD